MDVLFVVMPFSDITRPSIGVSLLAAQAQKYGFSARVAYFNVFLAETIGQELYDRIANGFPPELLVGEWFFADILFGNDIPHYDDYLSKILRVGSVGNTLREQLQKAREHRSAFVENCSRRIGELHPSVVGFTTTFHQTCSCLAVAKRIKEFPSPPVVVFGGANCEGEMGLQLVKSFGWIDYACLGEGDLVFPPLIKDILRGQGREGLSGIATRQDEIATSPETLANLDELPIPDYTDYFAQVESCTLASKIEPDLLIETSRGCWWGAKQHCTFCGLNGKTMTFRSKSCQRAFSELHELSERFQVKRFECVDNILNMKYIPSLFELLERSGLDLELFYEVKANLRYDQLEAMRAGGVRAIQPGIESFSNQVLQLMRKGCTGLQNIQLLRWCEELGIQVGWNLLTGFPGESSAEYRNMAELVCLLTHLQPPATCSPVRLDRFSPFFIRAEEFGLHRVRPSAAYYYVFPLGRAQLSKLAYFFDFDYVDGRQPLNYASGVSRAVESWHKSRTAAEQRPRLDAVVSSDEITIADTRTAAVSPVHRLSGTTAQIYASCDSVQGMVKLIQLFPPDRQQEAVRSVENLLNSKLMIEQDGHLLSLAVFRNRHRLPEVARQHVYNQYEQAQAPNPLLRVV